MAGRIGLNSLHPVIAHGELPSRAVVGEPVGIEATVFREGHDAVAASVLWRSPCRRGGRFNRMRPLGGGTDRWRAEVVPDSTGTWSYVVEAWGDPLATWYHAVEVKVDAGQSAEELANDLEVGARLFDRIADALSGVESDSADASTAGSTASSAASAADGRQSLGRRHPAEGGQGRRQGRVRGRQGAELGQGGDRRHHHRGRHGRGRGTGPGGGPRTCAAPRRTCRCGSPGR